MVFSTVSRTVPDAGCTDCFDAGGGIFETQTMNGGGMSAERKKDERTWWEGNQTKAWRLFVALFIAMTTFISTWMFTNVDQTKNDVSGLSDKYVTKSDFQCAIDKLERALDMRFSRLDSKMDDTNRYLRDHH